MLLEIFKSETAAKECRKEQLGDHVRDGEFEQAKGYDSFKCWQLQFDCKTGVLQTDSHFCMSYKVVIVGVSQDIRNCLTKLISNRFCLNGDLN